MVPRVIGSAVAERGRVVMLARVADRAGGRKDAVTAMLVPGAGIFGATALHEDRERLNMPPGRSLQRSSPMDKFVAKANIEHYRRKLAQETDETSLVSVAKGKIVWQNRHFQGFRRQVLLANGRRNVSHLRDDSPPHRTVCRCRPLPDGQRRGWPWPGGSRLVELSRGAASGAADELCRSRTAAAGRAA
jgi:hypothetical protein